MASGFSRTTPYNRSVEKRAAAFARLFAAVHEGVYIGAIGADETSTIAANPHLKLIFGHPGETPEADVRPFDRERFVDPQARVALVERLTKFFATVGIGVYMIREDGGVDELLVSRRPEW